MIVKQQGDGISHGIRILTISTIVIDGSSRTQTEVLPTPGSTRLGFELTTSTCDILTHVGQQRTVTY